MHVFTTAHSADHICYYFKTSVANKKDTEESTKINNNKL